MLECAAGQLLTFSANESNGRLAGAGEIAIGPDGEAYPCIYGSGYGSFMTSAWAESGLPGSYLPLGSSISAGAGGIYHAGSDWSCTRALACRPDALLDVTTSRRQFLPYVFGGDAVIGFPWKLRQIAYGVHGAMGETLLEAGGSGQVLALGMSPRRTATANGFHTLWATNFAV
ncbi:MAG: hypothetical protein ACOCXJ_09320 [Planctomycetota bacterium]